MQRIGWRSAAALSLAMGMAGCGGTRSQDPARSADRVNLETAALQRFEVTAITTGVDLPADGYGVLNDEWDYDVGDGVTVPIPTNGTVNLYLRPGGHILSLVGIPTNCAGEDVNDRYVIGAPDGAVTTVVFRVVCAPVSCTPTSCAALGRTCGTASDDCGGTLTCGPPCSAGSVKASYDAALKAPLCASRSSLCSATTTGRAGMGPEANSPNTLGAACADGTSGTFHSDESIDAVRVLSTTGAALSSGGAAQVEVDVWAYSGYSYDALDVFVTTTPASPVWSLVATKVPTKALAQTLTVPLTLPVSSSSRYAVRAQFRYVGSATPCASGPYNDRDDLVFALAAASGGSALTNGGLE